MSQVAVVGIGYWGPNLVRNFLAAGAEKVIACDSDEARLKTLARQVPAATCCRRFEEVLQNPDVQGVAIATPVRLHHPMTMAALQAGKGVLVEKPMAMTVAQAREMADLAERKRLTLMVDHTFIYTGAVEKIIEIVRSGSLGDFYYIDSVRINLGLFQHDVNVIWDLAPHDISIANHVLDRRPRIVRAFGQSHTDSGLADVAYLNVEYGDSIAANFHVNWLSPVKIRHAIFAGSNRMIVWNDLDPAEKLRVYDRGIEVARSDRDGQYRLQVGYRMGDAWLPQTDRTEALRKVAAHFLDCCRTGKKPLTGAQEGLDVMVALEAAEISLAQGGRPVRIEQDRLAPA